MTAPAWAPALAALDRAGDAGRTIEVWLRDDDAIAATGALDRLADLAAAFSMPVLLAVIPARAESELASWIADHASVTPCQHGYAHANHAAPGAKACELGGVRDVAAVIDDLRQGRARMRSLFGSRLADVLVPPWNRIAPGVIPRLAGLGFAALSTFGPPEAEAVLPRLNADLDIVDWRRDRVGRDARDVAGKLAALVEAAIRAPRPIGLLTHHLAHDTTAWTVLGEMLALLHHHPAVAFVSAEAALTRPHAIV